MVLPRPCSKRCLVVGLHPQRRGLIDRPLFLELGFDLGAALGERPELGAGEAFHLPGVVPIELPAHPELCGQGSLQMVLVDRAGRPGPLEQRAGVEGHMAAVAGPLHQVRHETMGMQLGISLPARAMHEPGHRPAARRHPPAHAIRLHPRHRRVESARVVYDLS